MSRKRWISALAGLLSFRVLVAMGLSTVVTAGVAGPLALQVVDAREAIESAEATRPSGGGTPGDTSNTGGGGEGSAPSGSTVTSTTSVEPTSPSTTAGETTTTAASGPTTAPVPSTTSPRPSTTGAPGTTSTATAPSTTAANSTSTTTTTTAPVTAEGILVSNRPDRSNATPLQGNTIFGDVYLFFRDDQAGSVRFWINDPQGSGAPRAVSASGPDFDLMRQGNNPAPLFSDGLGAGPHTLLVEARTPAGTTYRRLATFTVVTANS